MVREQKQAWFTIVVFLLTLITFVILLYFVRPIVAVAGFAVFGLAGLTPLLFRKKADPTEVDIDERDAGIGKTAALAGAMMSYGAFILACMILWSVCYYQGKEVVSIHTLPIIVFIGGMVLYVARAIVILVLYGREPKDVQD